MYYGSGGIGMGAIVGIVLLVLIILILISCIKVVTQAQALVVERLGALSGDMGRRFTF